MEEKVYKTSEAQRKAIKRYRENHREEILEYQKKYYESHYEKNKKVKRILSKTSRRS